MLIECDRCEMRDIACPDCVVTHLLADGEPVADLDPAERRALRVLADARLVSPLLLRPSAASWPGAAASGPGTSGFLAATRPHSARDTPAFLARHAGAGPAAGLPGTPSLGAICRNRNAWPRSSRSREFAKRLNSPCELH